MEISSENKELQKILNKFEINFVTNKINDKSCFDLSKFNSQHGFFINNLNCILKNMLNHKYLEIFSMNIPTLNLLQSFLKDHDPIYSAENGTIKSNFNVDCNTTNENFSYPAQLTLLSLAISSLQEFIRWNLSGPLTPDSSLPTCLNFINERFTTDQILSALNVGGESILTKVYHPELLFLSLILLHSHSFNQCITHKWWLWRCLFIHQQLLSERIPQLHNAIIDLVQAQKEMEFLNNPDESLARLLFFCECAHVHLFYHEVNVAEKYIVNAQNIMGLTIELTGAIGKRTRYQSKAVAQLLVKTSRNNDLYQSDLIINDNPSFVQDLVLQDDTVLNQIEFDSNVEDAVNSILPEEQITILAYCCLVQKKMAVSELKREEISSYVNYLLSQKQIWSLHVKALTLRCQIEKSASRKFDRALTQLEELINAVKKEDPPFSERQIALYAVAFPFKYNLEKLLADLLISIGSVKSALEIYERLQLWEDAVYCYKELGLTLKAKEILERLIAEKPSPLLWCYFGDVMDDPDKYLTAWELSNHRNARSQRSLGYYYFKRKDFKTSIDHFKLSTEINNLQPTVWFSLGYAATECQDFELAAKAYRQVVILDHDNFEAWNNLSNAYIKLKDKERAWRSLQEALKCNYEEWRVWENFLLVSIDIGAFEDVIRSYHRLLDIKHKHIDVEILSILVNAIDKDLKDYHDSPSARLKDKTLQLFGRITSITINNPKIWELYSILQCSNTDIACNKNILEKAVTFQSKAIRYYSQDSAWFKEAEAFKTTLKSAHRLCDLCSTYIKILETPSEQQQQKCKTKYLLQNIIAKTSEGISYFPDETLQLEVDTLKNKFELICAL